MQDPHAHPISWVFVALRAVGTLGLAGYSWRLKIGQRWMWVAVLFGHCVSIVAPLGMVFLFMGHPPESWMDLLTARWVVRPFAYGLVKTYPLFRYAFREDALWG
jgi:hypothetical protein